MILMDTDVVSFFIKGDPRRLQYARFVQGQRPAMSFMTAAELFQWAEFGHWGERRRANLEALLTERYLVLGVELGLAKEWARIRGSARDAGAPISVQDALGRRHCEVLRVTAPQP